MHLRIEGACAPVDGLIQPEPAYPSELAGIWGNRLPAIRGKNKPESHIGVTICSASLCYCQEERIAATQFLVELCCDFQFLLGFSDDCRCRILAVVYVAPRQKPASSLDVIDQHYLPMIFIQQRKVHCEMTGRGCGRLNPEQRCSRGHPLKDLLLVTRLLVIMRRNPSHKIRNYSSGLVVER